MSGSWQTDPSGHHQYRWWDGTDWTAAVSDNGIQSTDPLRAPAVTAPVTIAGPTGPTNGSGSRWMFVAAGLVVLAGVGIGAALAMRGGEDTAADGDESDNSDSSDSSDSSDEPDITDQSDDRASADERGVEGELVEDEDGQWSMVINGDWDEGTIQIGDAFWTTGTGSDLFQDNLNIFVEDFNGQAIDLQGYVDFSVANLPTLLPDAEFISDELVETPDGAEVAVLEYESPNASGQLLRFLGVIAVGDDHAVTSTFASEADRFSDAIADVRPYMESLRAE